MKWQYLVRSVWYQDQRRHPDYEFWVIGDSDKMDYTRFPRGLEDLGAEGWELVGVHERWNPGGGFQDRVPAFYIFKRAESPN
jgi:hypothetical protein